MATSSFRHGYANDDSDSDSDDDESNTDRDRRDLEIAGIEGIDDKTRRRIEHLFQKTVDNASDMSVRDARDNEIDYRYRKLVVYDIQRVVNPNLKTRYEEKKVDMKLSNRYHRIYRTSIRKLPKSRGEVTTRRILNRKLTTDTDINEYFLFHGTLTTNVESITKDGLMPAYADKLSVFGPGIYCTEFASKADQYADKKGNREPNGGINLQMFLVRALMGNVFVSDDLNELSKKEGCPKFKRPPCMCCAKSECPKGGQLYYDSVLGEREGFYREFVLYEQAQIYPEFLITYGRV